MLLSSRLCHKQWHRSERQRKQYYLKQAPLAALNRMSLLTKTPIFHNHNFLRARGLGAVCTTKPDKLLFC